MNDSPLLLDIWKQLYQISADLRVLKSDIHSLFVWCQRLSVLVALWGVGILGNLSSAQMAQVLTSLLKHWIGG